MGEHAGNQVWNHHDILDVSCPNHIPKTNIYGSLHNSGLVSCHIKWNAFWRCVLYTIGFIFSVLPLSAQGYVSARRECMDPSVMNATLVSSTSAALAVGPVSVTTTPTTAIHSPVSLLIIKQATVSVGPLWWRELFQNASPQCGLQD